jgi:hypothetical protein
MRERHLIPEIQEAPFGAPAHADLRTALDDFFLSRQAFRRTPATVDRYRYAVGDFVSWLESRGIRVPSELHPSHPRVWLAEMPEEGLTDAARSHWRSDKTFRLFRGPWNLD